MAHLAELVNVFQAFPRLQETVNTEKIFLFIDLCCHLRPELDLIPSYDPSLPPLMLPWHIQAFLAESVFQGGQKGT
jgi:hypothetical protein